MKLRLFFVAGLSLIPVAAATPLACAPDSSLPPSQTFPAGSAVSASATSSGSGAGGGLFESGTTCVDPTDTDSDLVADSLELAPSQDTDGDGTLDKDDTDSDADGYPDAEEAANPLLDVSDPGQMRDDPCDALADTDGDGTPDLRDGDSDNDGVPDKAEAAYDPTGSLTCRVLVDCDNDGVIDIVESAGGSDPTDPSSVPADVGLYFVLPYNGGEKTKDFTFSTGIAKADIYFLIDTTQTMQPAIDDLKTSLNTQVIPTVLNGDLTKNPPIPAIEDAWIGAGDFRDVPWGVYGQPGDHIYRNRFNINMTTVVGNVAPPVPNGPSYQAPANVQAIIGSLVAAQGGDGPESTTQALWIASTNQPYAATIGGVWSPALPYPAPCSDPAMFGVPCFRPQSLPIFVLITDAAFHNGPIPTNVYNPQVVGGTKTYQQTIDAIKAINAKVVGVPVAGNNPGAARADMSDLAMKTGSLYHDPAFGGNDYPLVPTADVSTGQVSDEVVRLLGLLAGAGLHDVTTSRGNYDCAGGTDCTGDGMIDLEYHNPVLSPDVNPFDASKLITKVATVPSQTMPLPYASLTADTFYGVRGAAQVTFRVHANNTTVKPPTLLVMRALIRVQTPAGQILGGKDGIKLVYFVIPEYIDVAH